MDVVPPTVGGECAHGCLTAIAVSRLDNLRNARMLTAGMQALRGEVDRLQQTVSTLMPGPGPVLRQADGREACIVTIRIPGCTEVGQERQLGSTVVIHVNGSGSSALVRD